MSPVGAALHIHTDVAVQVELYPLGSPREGHAAGNLNKLFTEEKIPMRNAEFLFKIFLSLFF